MKASSSNNWPGSGEIRPYAGHVTRYDKPISNWQAEALEWCEANIKHARRRATARAIIARVPLFLEDESLSADDDRPFACFSQRQLADATGYRHQTISEVIKILECGPLHIVMKPKQHDSSTGSCYELVFVSGAETFVSGAETFVSGAETFVSGAETFVSGTVNNAPQTAPENGSSGTETPTVSAPENGSSGAVNNAPQTAPSTPSPTARCASSTRTPGGVVDSQDEPASVDSLVSVVTANVAPPRLRERGATALKHETSLVSFEDFAPLARKVEEGLDLTDEEKQIYHAGYHQHNLNFKNGFKQ